MLYGEQRWIDMDRLDKDQVVVVCPLASVEQHGHHLPLLTDTILVTGVAEGVHEKLGDKILLTPTLWLGASDHHLDFPGTVTVPNTLYTEMIKALLRSFVRGGFKRILFLNGHGGNVTPGVNAITEMSNSCDDCDGALVALSSYWTIAAPAMDAARHGMATPQLSHACEYETSMVLHLRSDLVKMPSAVGCDPVIESDWFSSERLGRLNVPHRFHRRSATGAMGKPEAATAEKGGSLLAAVVDEVSSMVEEFHHWQHCNILKPARAPADVE